MNTGVIKVMIVEDETLVRMGIRAVVDRDRNGYTVIAEADNGLDAVKKIGAMNPDIVLMDITLPGIDGLEVLRRVRAAGYRGHILMLTCHESFQMARQAIRDGADDYVLKSEVTGENLITYLQHIKLPQDEGPGGGISLQGEQKRNLLLNLLSIGFEKDMDFARIRERYQLKFSENNMFLVLVQINDYSKVICRYAQEDKETFFIGMRNLLETAFAQYPEHELVQKEPDIFVVFISFAGEFSVARVTERLKSLAVGVQNSLETLLNVSTVVCISRPVLNIARVNADFTHAKKLLDESFFFPQKKILYDDESRSEDGFTVLLNMLKQDLREMLGKNSPFKPLDAVKKFLQEYPERKVEPDKNAFTYVINDFLDDLQRNSDSPDLSMRVKNQTMEQLMNQLAAVQNGSGDAVKPQNYLVTQAIDYICANYMRDINLDIIAEHIGITSSYLSRIFARITGENVSTYIMNKRIECAKQILRTSNLKHYEIAEKCGLNSSAYFASTFKKITGMTPKQYRNTQG